MSLSARYPSLHGRSVFISGGATGIGADFVAQFHAQGSKVAFVDRDVAAGEALAARLAADGVEGSTTPRFIACDVTDIGALRRAIDAAHAAFGPIRVLVNNAANDQRKSIAEVTPAFWDDAVAVNLKHQFFAAQAVAPDMAAAGGGSIINLGSVSWMIKGSGYPAYATCKSAIQGLTRSLARDLGKQGIRVNSILPGWVMTARQLAMWVDAEGERTLDANQCLPGRLQPEHISAMALFLAADDACMCTAQSYIVDAGWA